MSTDRIWQIRSTGSADTERLGELLGKLLKYREVIELRSDLGGGKTTFVRGLVRGIGSKNRVSSPTFKLNNIYKTDHVEVHHFDFYRLQEPGVLSEQLQESLQNPRVVTVVEWSDIIKHVLPKSRLTIEFKLVADNLDERNIEISYPESKVGLVEKLETEWTRPKP